MDIFIPTPLRPYAESRDTIELNAPTIAEALDLLTLTRPAPRKHLLTEEGKLRAFVSLYFNDEDLRYLPEREQTTVSSADRLSIIPSIAVDATLHQGQPSIRGIDEYAACRRNCSNGADMQGPEEGSGTR